MNTTTPKNSYSFSSKTFGLAALVLFLLVTFVFQKSFDPSQVLFANDANLGILNAQKDIAWSNFLGYWQDLNWVGGEQPSGTLTPTAFLYASLGPIGFSKYYTPISLLILGISTWLLFWQLRMHPVVCLLGAIAAMFNSNFFSNACWGLPTRALSLAFAFLATACILGINRRFSWLKLFLAGLAVGLGVMEAYDVGALFAIYVALFVVFCTLNLEAFTVRSLVFSLPRLGVVVASAVFISIQALTTLIGTQISGVTGMEQDAATKERRWDDATQWSLPKIEILRVIIPGLFGYRMDTPDGGDYWGTVGRRPGWETHHAGMPRFSGAGEYAGILVVLLAIYAIAQSFRGKKSSFSPIERRWIWFWTGLGAVTLVLAFGRYAPFYQFFYTLPYFSTMRNPMKFMHLWHMTTLVLFGYGLQLIWRLYVEPTPVKEESFKVRLQSWWKTASGFERNWTWGCLIALGISFLSWLVFAAKSNAFEAFLQQENYSVENAAAISRFCAGEIMWFIFFLAVSISIVLVVFTRTLSGAKSKWAGILLGVILFLDLARANSPWIRYYSYADKYASNPIIDLLRQKPFEKRVIVWPYSGDRNLALFQNLYGIEWIQHLFSYYNIQSLDVIQEPRTSAANDAFRKTLPVNNLALVPRLWQLTNTRFILGGSSNFVEALNAKLDPLQHRFRVHTAFDLAPKRASASKLEDITVMLNPTGQLAVVEFTGALPRASLYSRWQTETNDAVALQTLANPVFDPTKVVLTAHNLPANSSTNQNAGSVQFDHYEPKYLRLNAKAETPAVLLLNDKFEPAWKVWVDGKPESLLRCNFLMRGVYLTPGQHTVEFRFQPSSTSFYISLAALICGALILALLIVAPVLWGQQEKAT